MKWPLIFLAYLSLFALSFLDNGRAPSYNSILSDLAIGPAKGSYIFTVASFISLLVNISAKYWLPKIGPIKATQIALLLLTSSGASMYLTGHYSSYPLLIFSSCLLGLGLAICTICMNILVTKGSNEKLRSKLFSGLHAIYGLSSFAAPFVIALILNLGGDWKLYFLIIALLPLFVMIYSFRVNKLNLKAPSTDTFETGVPLRFRILFGLIFGCYVGSELVLSSRIPYYLENYLSYSTITSGNYLSLFFLSLTAGRVLFSFISFKLSTQKLLFISYALTFICFFLGRFVSPVFLSLCGLTMSFAFPMAMDYLVQTFGTKSDYMITSVMTWIGVILAIVHMGFGLINEYYGSQYAIFLSPFLSLVSALSLVIFLKIKKSHL
ncbi:sugar MFS transporter [Halobacteriovorax sp. HLS]|uniref:MFS transporter n=1 Tax=Halobacteriovorax sp. HLS TaxID=2234000 RepID=UPI000FD79FBC|nr:MFS transporter [Halobacteriovorax sp. HLS]